MTNPASGDIIYPTSDRGLLQDKRIALQVLDVVLHALFESGELQEVNFVYFLERRIVRIRVLHELAQLRRSEGQHSTAGMVEDSYLASSKQALRDDDGTKGVLTVKDSLDIIRDGQGVDVRAAACVADDVRITFVYPKLSVYTTDV